MLKEAKDNSWMSKAACIDSGLAEDIFFPNKAERRKANFAKTFCSCCSVTEECLDYALDNNERHGVWGGKSERDRRLIAKERGITQSRSLKIKTNE